MSRRIASIALVALLAIVLSAGSVALAQPHDLGSPDLATSSTDATNLLTNGDMDDGIFYWRPTNHYVAFPWFEWWANHLTIPEYIDGSKVNHNQCYPEPPPGMLCQQLPTGANHSQGYIRWGLAFDAGIYQPVTSGIEQCTLYTFTAWNRNDGDTYRAQVGIDVSGWIIPLGGGSGEWNCPPDLGDGDVIGDSECPNPHIASFPGTTKWSAPSNHPAFTWKDISITAEAVGPKLSVWTRSAPVLAQPGPQTTYWDYASLVRVPFPEDRLPTPLSWAPSDFISVTSVTADLDAGTASITWTTSAPASTQVWYAIHPPNSPITPTSGLTHTVYFPVIASFRPPSTYMTPLDTTPLLTHQATISGVPAGQTLVFVALSRRPDGMACRTESSALYEFTMASGLLATLDSAHIPILLPEPVTLQP
ncbi:MAG: hypothetical protein MUF84_09270 [Anaerolineae bacterium]|jgi:hypothetical protein|nr:hypothetical protein [Anaerolineae bacterium]